MKSALISGGTGGLGTAVTLRLLRDGWRCVVPYRDEPGALRLRALGADAKERLLLQPAELESPEAAQELVAQADQPDAPLHALVNLAGGFDAPGPVHATPVERFEQQLRANLRPTYLLSSAAIECMLRRSAGAVVCVSSRAALQPFAGASGYITAKAALLAFVDALAIEYREQGIRANAIIPGVIDTAANRSSQPQADHTRWVTPEQIADVIAFLCSDDAACVSGAHLPVYGRS